MTTASLRVVAFCFLLGASIGLSAQRSTTVSSTDETGPQKHWALLVAGTNLYMNYRHQADVCHAYHIVRNHGIPEERIVVMMYDDIAYNKKNPFPGTIINEYNGTNVYKGVIIDYKGEEVRSDVFLKVLSGDSAGVEEILGRRGKVIESGPNDRIFVNFVGHGAPEVLGFPNDELYADSLNRVLEDMHSNRRYKQMVIYTEACFAGSMFHRILSPDINVFATTASNRSECSLACCWDEARHIYLGDVYSVNWMDDSDDANLKSETLEHQFKLVKMETNTSHVMQYGDLSLSKLPVADFQGNLSDPTLRFRPRQKRNPNLDAVSADKVHMEILKRNNDKVGLHNLINRQDAIRRFFNEVAISVSKFDYWFLINMDVDIYYDFKCYKMSIAAVKRECPGMRLFKDAYALKNLVILANLCEVGVDVDYLLAKIRTIAKITSLCVPDSE